MEHDAWFFIGVFAFIFLIWIATGGPIHPLSFSGPKLAQPEELGGGTYLSLPRAPFGVGGTDVSLSVSGDSGRAMGRIDAAYPSLVGDTAFGTISPYRGVVTMSHHVSGAGSEDPQNEYIELRVSGNPGNPINISGWTIRSGATDTASALPKGTEVPLSGTINATEDIMLADGARALIISGRSPIGASFRENKCIGYFSSFQKFYPQLPQNCPVPSDELASFYGVGYVRDAACIDYVNKLSRCQVALSPPVGASGSCQNFMIKYLNYNGCVEAHRKDIDFKGDVWRVYLNRSNSMWRAKHEIVKLLDASGKTVDAFSY